MDELKNKVALVTGASRGIGAACALALARAGADVAVNYHTRRKDAERVCAQIRKCGCRAIGIAADVSRVEAVRAMVAQAERDLGQIGILVNNAGIARVQKIEEITESDFDEILHTNLKSCFFAIQAVLPGMRAQGWGRIINMSSIAAQTGGVIGPHYAASKAGMLGLTHSLALRLAKSGITVNAIAPALIETEMVRGNPGARAEAIPIGRLGTVEETASVVVELAKNGYITGQTINVNGGAYLA